MKRQYGAPLVVPTIDGERKAICTPGQKQCLDRCLPVIKEILAAHLSRWDDALAMSIALAGCLPPWVTSEKDPGARKAIQCLQAEIRRLREAAAKIREAWDALPPGVQGGLPVNIRPTHFPSEDRDPLDDVLAFAADTESAVTAALKRWPRNPRGGPQPTRRPTFTCTCGPCSPPGATPSALGPGSSPRFSSASRPSRPRPTPTGSPNLFGRPSWSTAKPMRRFRAGR